MQPMELNPEIFRAYDIRGQFGTSLTEAGIYQIGQGLGSYAIDVGVREFVIARDGRLSGPILSCALTKGILSTGCHVIDIGMVPTPVLYFATHLFPDHSGIMLTGSHNPPDYNGVKIVLQGCVFCGARIQELYQRITTTQFAFATTANLKQLKQKGTLHHVDIMPQYIQTFCENIKLNRPLRVVVDAGNGVSGLLAPDLYTRLGCDVEPLFCDVDGNFPNHHPDPSNPNNLQMLIAAVTKSQADIGLAFDGDGDRLGIVTSAGEIIYPDRLLMLFAQSILTREPNHKIIFDVKCTDQLAPLIRAYQGEPIMWKTGHSLIKEKIAETKATLAGEMSGHFFFADRWFGFDDALYAGARLLEILAQQEKNSADLFATLPNPINTPELKIQVAEEEKFSLMQTLMNCVDFKDAIDIITIDGLRISFDEGWGLIRPSNTTPCLILRFEAKNQTFMQKIQQQFRTWLLSVKPDLVLPF